MKSSSVAGIEIERVSLTQCPRCAARSTPTQRFYRRHGWYRTAWDGRYRPRYRCVSCRSTFSQQTFRKTFGQHRPDVNQAVFELAASGVTQRRMARVLRVARDTVAAKILFLAKLSESAHELWLAQQGEERLVHFDEMETFEHTKLKPVSIALAVHARTGAIVGTAVEPIAYKGRLAHVAFKKYGPRPDRSGFAIQRVLETVRRAASPDLVLVTDESPKYPRRIRRVLPTATHRAVRRVPSVLAKRRRNVDDPLFALNVTAAKLRSDLARLSRKTWVTTKKLDRLASHLSLYVAWNNGYRLRV